MQKTKKKTISFRVDEDKCETLDKVASSIGEDRTYILNQAIDNIMNYYAWESAEIKEGERQADNGEFISKSEWKKLFNR